MTRNTIADTLRSIAQRMESKPEVELVDRSRMLPAEVNN
jgi:hypothetical protein